MNLFDEYQIPRTEPVPPKVIPAVHSGHDIFSCRRCGYGLPDSDRKRRWLYVNNSKDLECHWKYCPNCGQAIMHASFAGCKGWNAGEANKRANKIIEKYIALHIAE